MQMLGLARAGSWGPRAPWPQGSRTGAGFTRGGRRLDLGAVRASLWPWFDRWARPKDAVRGISTTRSACACALGCGTCVGAGAARCWLHPAAGVRHRPGLL